MATRHQGTYECRAKKVMIASSGLGAGLWAAGDGLVSRHDRPASNQAGSYDVIMHTCFRALHRPMAPRGGSALDDAGRLLLLPTRLGPGLLLARPGPVWVVYSSVCLFLG